MEGSVVANSGWHPGGRRFYKKIGGGCQARGAAAIQFHEIETGGGERRGEEPVEKEKENEKISSSGGVSLLGMESTEERAEAQKWRPEEQLRRFAAAAAPEGEEWKRKGGGWPLERIILTDDEEDGVNGDRMKPLASFDVNRGMPPAQNRKLKLKLSPPDNNQPPVMDGAVPKTIRRAQEKENGGLVALCPGTTQIRGFKRKTISPTDLKPQEGKRNRLPFGSGKETAQSRKEPAESSSPSPLAEIESEESHGMDMLLMALKAADSERSISPSLPLAKPRVIQTISGEKAGKNSKPTTKVGGAIMTAHLYRPRQEKIKENVDARKEDDVEWSCIRNDDVGEESEGFQPCPRTKTCNKASPPRHPEFLERFFTKWEARWASSESDNREEKLEASKEEDGSDDTEDGPRVTSKTASKTTTGQSDTSRDGEEMPVFRDDELHEYAAATLHRFRPHPPVKPLGESTNLLDGRRKENRGEQSPRCLDRNEAGIKPHLPKLHPSQSRVLLSQIMQLKSIVQSEPRNEDEYLKTSCFDEENDGNIIMMKLQSNNKPLFPRQTTIVLSEQQNFNQRVPKECRVSGASSSTVLDSHHHHHQQQQQQQRKVIERESTGQNSGVTIISLRGEGPEIAEKSQDINREGFARDNQLFRKATSWTKYQFGPRQQSTKKESSAAGWNVSNQLPWEYIKKRKASDHVSTCCIVPKQVKLATASSLIETGEPSHASVGSVVVECLPPSTEQRKDDINRAPFCELQNRDALWSHNSLQLPSLKSATDAGLVGDLSKENRSWNVSSTSASDHCPSNAGFKAPSKQVYDGAAEPPRLPRVAGSTTLGGTLSANGNSLLSLQNSKTHLGSGSHSAHGTHPQEQQQQRSSATLAAGSITRTRDNNEDNETHHEIAGITMQRRSWEALKEAEYFAKRRFHPDAPEAPFDQQQQHHRPNVPSIPSRFQGGGLHHHVQGVVSTLTTKYGATLTFNGAATGAFAGYAGGKKVTSYKPKPEKLSVKVLNRNLENYALKDGAPNFQNGAQGFPGNGCHSTHLPRSGLPKAPKTRQRRGQKKLEKEKFMTINVKPSSGVCNFKPLAKPSGLLGDCNPGIIQRVRNSVQIHAILGAFIGAASYNSRVPKVPLDAPSVQLAITEGKGELTEKPADVQETLRKEKCSAHAETTTAVEVQENVLRLEYSTQAETLSEIRRTSSAQENSAKIIEIEKLLLPQGRDPSEETLNPEEVAVSTSERREALAVLPGDVREGLPETTAVLVSLTETAVDADCLHEQSDAVKQGLAIYSEDPALAEEDNDNDEELHPMSGTDSSPSAAGLAGRWLELLTLDIKGRLSALKRSRSRVQSTLQSGELNPSESGGAARVRAFDPLSKTRSSIDIIDVHGSQQSVCTDGTTTSTTTEARQDESSSQQLDRWRAIFTTMDSTLGTEATKLESCLRQVKQMQEFRPSSNSQQLSVTIEKSNVAAAFFQRGLATKHLEIEKQQSPQRLPYTIEAIEKQVRFFATASTMSASDFVTKPQTSR